VWLMMCMHSWNNFLYTRNSDKLLIMLQRIQSIWLLLVAVFAAITFRFPFYNGDWLKDLVQAPVDLNARTTIWLSILTVITGAIGFVTIFLFDNRRLQLRLCYLGMFLSVILLVMYFLELNNFESGSIALWCIFYFAILVCYIMAARSIWKDEKLVKSMDRLR
jgi:arginine/ornithine N-succinyltransferase beta subunit